MTLSFTSGGPADTMGKLHEHKWGAELDRLSGPGIIAGAGLTHGAPYEVKYLSVDAVARGELIGAAHATQWRTLLSRGDAPAAEVEFDDDHVPIALHEGPGKDGFRAAMQQAESLQGDFHVSVVKSAPLKFIALLLSGAGEPVLIPYAPNLTSLPNYQVISVADALKVLKPLAASVLEASSAGDAKGG